MEKRNSVFVSYSSMDHDIAFALKEKLEQHGKTVWIAPNDIPAGASYASCIENALATCQMFLILLSQRSIGSIWVEKELDRALANGCSVIPVMIERCALSSSFKYYLGNIQTIFIGDAIDEFDVKAITERLGETAAAQEPVMRDEASFLDIDARYVLKYLATDPMAYARGAWLIPAAQQITYRGYPESQCNGIIARLVERGYATYEQIASPDSMTGEDSVAPAVRLTPKAELVLRDEAPIKDTYRYVLLFRRRFSLFGKTSARNAEKLLVFLHKMPFVQGQTREGKPGGPYRKGAQIIYIFAYREIDLKEVAWYARSIGVDILELKEADG